MKRRLSFAWTRRRPAGGTVRSSRLSRSADRYGGSLILFGLGLLRRSKPMLPNPSKLGICVFGAIGDAIICSTISVDLKRRYPNLRVTMIVSATNQGTVALLDGVDDYLVLPISRPVSAIRALRRQHFDLLIDANQWIRLSAVCSALSGATRTIGFRTPGQHRHFAYDDVVDHSSARHELDNFRALLAPLGIRGTTLPRVRSDQPPQPDGLAASPTGPYVVFHPWAGGHNAALKQWPEQNWIDLANHLLRKDVDVLVIGAPADAPATETMAAAGLAQGVRITSLAGRLSLAQTASVLAQACFVVSVNTGIMHLAAATGTPVIGLHGPTNPRRWGPLGPRAVSVVPDAPGDVPTSYLNLGFEFPRNVVPCMPFISVRQVMDAVDRAGLLLRPRAAVQEAEATAPFLGGHEITA